MNLDTEEEKEYWKLLESTQQRWYPEVVHRMSNQTELQQQEGRVAVIKFEDETKPSVKLFETSKALRRYLDKYPPAKPADVPVLRRAFVLEELPRKFVQVLGSKIRVPPSFFTSHWSGLGGFTGRLLNRTPRHYDNRNRFTLTSPRLHQAKIEEKEGDKKHPIYYMESSIDCKLSCQTVFGDFNGPLLSFERVSFWSVCEGESWDVVLLVDPSLGNFVRWQNDPEPRKVYREVSRMVNSPDTSHTTNDSILQSGSWYPPYTSSTTQAPLPTDWEHAAPAPAPAMQSLFEDILCLYPLEQRQSTANPTNCTDICRKLVLCAWTARLRVVEAQVIQKFVQMSVGADAANFNAATWLDKSWTLPWQERNFAQLVRAKSELEGIEAGIDNNMDALGIGCKSQTTEEWEAEAWRSLQNTVAALKKRVDMTLQSYTEAVSVRQAQQVGYLTSLATLFIPASFVAAIFAMGGDYSASAGKFWVFWVISVPLVLLCCIILFTHFGVWLLRLFRKCLGYGEVEKSHV